MMRCGGTHDQGESGVLVQSRGPVASSDGRGNLARTVGHEGAVGVARGRVRERCGSALRLTDHSPDYVRLHRLDSRAGRTDAIAGRFDMGGLDHRLPSGARALCASSFLERDYSGFQSLSGKTVSYGTRVSVVLAASRRMVTRPR